MVPLDLHAAVEHRDVELLLGLGLGSGSGLGLGSGSGLGLGFGLGLGSGLGLGLGLWLWLWLWLLRDEALCRRGAEGLQREVLEADHVDHLGVG